MARERPEGPREASAACASTSFCAPSDLRTRESAPKYAHGYAKRHGGCSNRNELHACVCVPFPSIPADQRWCPWTVALGLLVVRRFAKMYRHIRLNETSDFGSAPCCRRPLAPTPTCAPRRASSQHLARETPQPTRGRPAIASQTESPPRGRQGAAHRLARLALQPSRRVAPLAPPPKTTLPDSERHTLETQ